LDPQLRISTLRGQYIDNREWLTDPTAPAIVVGTVDMIGSRLLFSGYGVTKKMRPFHAGFLGVDTLVVLDEAHLVLPFEALLRTIADDPKNELWPRAAADRKTIRLFRQISLSATGRGEAENVFRLAKDDLQNEIVRERLHATKRLTLVEAEARKLLVEDLAGRAWALGKQAGRLLVYCNSREDALKVKAGIERRANREKIDAPAELLVGERRVREREGLFLWLKQHGFVDTRDEEPHMAFLIATSAGEVGIDLDADHMVCDLVEWERMVQRFGRVNRRGKKDATVEVIASAPIEKKLDTAEWEARLSCLRALGGDASPAAIVALKQDRSMADLVRKAESRSPLRPLLTRALVDAWSMTSLDEHSGRPEVEPWLRGWIVEQPQTAVVWRRFPPVRTDGNVSKKEVDEFFEAAPPQLSETLEAPTWRVADWLVERAAETLRRLNEASAPMGLRADSVVLFVLDHKDELIDHQGERGAARTLGALARFADKAKKKDRESLAGSLSGRTIVVSSRLGGVTTDGMLDETADGEPSTIDADESWPSPRQFRVQERTDASARVEGQWREIHRFVADQAEDGEPLRWLVVEQRRDEAQSEDGRAVASGPQLLDDHQARVTEILDAWGRELNLPEDYLSMLRISGRLHDEGKRAWRWQRAFNAPPGRPYAKTRGPINQQLLDGYRHEFGSLAHIESDSEFRSLSYDLQDLVRHVVSAHHGGARPSISTRSCDDAPPSALDMRAREVALRFAHLQKRWGPWGLAWWEALLRAADQRASAETAGSGGGVPVSGEGA
jgi:CRISPR-associated endonuclease/helicase Cas3